MKVRATNESPSEQWPLVFDSDEAWRLYLHNGTRCFVFGGRTPGTTPHCTALVEGAFDRVVVSCGPQLRLTDQPTPTLSNPVHYPLDQILLMYWLAPRRGAIVHASLIRIDGRCWLLAGRSGAGKSTLARTLSGAPGVQVLNDDRAIVRRCNSEIHAFGTPWPGEARCAEDASGPLGGICFLRQSDANHATPLTPREALDRLLPVVSIPWYESVEATAMLGFLDDLLATIPTHELSFTKNADAETILGALQ